MPIKNATFLDEKNKINLNYKSFQKYKKVGI